MRKYLLGILAATLAVLVGIGGLAPVMAASKANQPRNSQNGVHYNPSFIGLTSYLLHETVTATAIATESGLLYGICRVGGVLDDYAVAYDYATSDTLATLFSGGPGEAESDGYIMSPQVFTDTEGSAEVYVQAASVRGCWYPKWPLRFEDGLVGENNSATGYSIFMWRADDGTNPI